MFQDSLFATNPRRNPQRGWAAFLSFVVQASFVTVLVALPLFFTEALPIGTSTEVVPLPPVPRGTPPAQPPEVAHQKPTTSNVDQQGRLIAVRVIPRSVAHIVERAAPPPEGAYTSVVGATGDNGDPNGVLQSVLTDGARIAPALKPPPPAKGAHFGDERGVTHPQGNAGVSVDRPHRPPARHGAAARHHRA